jgi:hypothetical protein
MQEELFLSDPTLLLELQTLSEEEGVVLDVVKVKTPFLLQSLCNHQLTN